MTVPYAAPIPSGLTDPGVALPISLVRHSGKWVGNGVWAEDNGNPVTVNGSGIIHPTTADELRALPEGQRVLKSITLFWPQGFVLDDRIQYGGEEYRVVLVDPYTNYGYNRAVAQVVQL